MGHDIVRRGGGIVIEMRKKCIPMSNIINNSRHVFVLYCFIDISSRIFICFRGTMCQYASTFTRHTLSTANRLSHLNDQSKEMSQCDTGKSDDQSHLSFNVMLSSASFQSGRVVYRPFLSSYQLTSFLYKIHSFTDTHH